LYVENLAGSGESQQRRWVNDETPKKIDLLLHAPLKEAQIEVLEEKAVSLIIG
jgi:hypothetical protein